MPYLFPVPQVSDLEDALDIAMDYLERKPLAIFLLVVGH